MKTKKNIEDMTDLELLNDTIKWLKHKLQKKNWYENNKKLCNDRSIKYYKDNKTVISKQMKTYRDNNKERLIENKRKYYETNKPEIIKKQKVYVENNRDKIKIYKKNYRNANNKTIKETAKKYRENNKDSMQEYQKEYYNDNKDLLSTRMKKYYKDNKEHAKVYSKIYREENKESLREYKKRGDVKSRRNCARKDRYKNDPIYKLNCILRRRIKEELLRFKTNQFSKNITLQKNKEIFGCSPQQLKEYIESKFQEGMSWENHGLFGWHLDHIIPLNQATTVEELIKLNHYTNLRPLWAKDNLSRPKN